ncbi:putative effector protein [Erysiphe necator]|uniref:Putative effector protein n=1 Tax=Uncinula necator TaxID=52586 RepID=A0A0B1PIE0_UNCNE|nr:putative effector protein [Erysiphe necator]
MAPPALTKRALPPDPPDVGNRVSKPTSTLNRSNSIAISKAHSTRHTKAALQKSSTLEKKLGVVQFSIDEQDEQDDEDLEMDAVTGKPSTYTINTDPFDEDFPPLTGVSELNAVKITQNEDNVNETKKKKNATSLMDAIKSLLDLTNPFLQKLEEDHPGVGTDFIALLADGASRAIRGERIYTSLQKTSPIYSKVLKPTWAEKAGVLENGQKIPLKKQTIRATPPHGQSKEDRRVIIRLSPDHEARKISSFELRQKIQLLIPDKTLIADVWTVPSGVAILAPTPAKAAALLQFKEVIENRFGDACVE